MYKSRRIKNICKNVKANKLIHLDNSFWYNDIDYITTQIEAMKREIPLDNRKHINTLVTTQYETVFREITLIHLKNGAVLVEDKPKYSVVMDIEHQYSGKLDGWI